MRDYYEVLGVSRDATTEEIRRAYRKKARQLHPDYAGPESEEAFKELSVAYEVLSDPQKRERYNLGGYDSPLGGSPGAGAFGFADLFDAMFGGGVFSPFQAPERGRPGRDSKVRADISLQDAVFGTKEQIILDTAVACGTCKGTCAAPGTSAETCTTCQGRGQVTKIQSSLLGQIRVAVPCTTCSLSGRTIRYPCDECRGEGRVRVSRTISVDIPAGVQDGSRIKLRGQGEAGARGGADGDLYVEVHVKPDPLFTRRGYDLHTSITVPMTTAALGVVFPLTTFDGEKEIVVEPGTQPGEEIVLRGLGVTRMGTNSRGDLFVHVDVEVPTKLDSRSRELIEELAKHRGEDGGDRPPLKPGVFGRLRDALGA